MRGPHGAGRAIRGRRGPCGVLKLLLFYVQHCTLRSARTRAECRTEPARERRAPEPETRDGYVEETPTHREMGAWRMGPALALRTGHGPSSTRRTSTLLDACTATTDCARAHSYLNPSSDKSNRDSRPRLLGLDLQGTKRQGVSFGRVRDRQPKHAWLQLCIADCRVRVREWGCPFSCSPVRVVCASVCGGVPYRQVCMVCARVCSGYPDHLMWSVSWARACAAVAFLLSSGRCKIIVC